MLLDTLRMQRRLREVGFPDEQADVITEEIANLVTGELATKADLRELRTEMNDKFAEVRGEVAVVRGEVAKVASAVADLKTSMADFKTGIVKWMVGLVAAMLLGVGGMVAAMVVTLLRVAG